MKTQDIRSMGLAYLEVLEGKAVNKHGHDVVGQEDPDVNNDKKVNSTDKYLLNRRKAISANIRKEEVEEVDEALVGNQHKIDANKNGRVDAHDFKLLRGKKPKTEEKEEGKAHETAEKKKNESAEWPIFARIQEKLTLPSYKVSGIGDDPHEVTVKYSKDPHTKGATPPEKIDSKASDGEKDFIAKHGGLDGNDSGINAHEYAAKNSVAHTTNVKVAPGRHNDQKTGDKNIIKSKS